MEIAYVNRLNVNKDAFVAKLREVSEFLQVHPSWLMVAIWIESKLNRKAINKTSGATGLIQWIPRYVHKMLGLPNVKWVVQQKIMGMSGVEQLELIKKFLAPYRGRMTDQYQTYLAIFSPAALGKPETYIIGKDDAPGHTGQAYDWNSYLDTKFGNRDGKITLHDIRKFVDAHTPAGSELHRNHLKPNPTTRTNGKICPCCKRPF